MLYPALRLVLDDEAVGVGKGVGSDSRERQRDQRHHDAAGERADGEETLADDDAGAGEQAQHRRQREIDEDHRRDAQPGEEERAGPIQGYQRDVLHQRVDGGGVGEQAGYRAAFDDIPEA